MKRVMTGLGLVLMMASIVYATENNSSYFPLEEVKPGMTAVGRTVFEGDQAQEFGVEILGVIKGFLPTPKRSLIIIRLKGPLTDRSGVFAGMSGSPVFINGKLVGAIAYALPFSKEPIGAITPIQEMLSAFQSAEEETTSPRRSTAVSFSELAAASRAREFDPAKTNLMNPLGGLQPVTIDAQAAIFPTLAPLVGQTLMPIATPISFGGVDPTVMQYFTNYFQAMGFHPVAGVSGTSSTGGLAATTAETLAPGKSVAVELVRGDISLAAAGTVTWRDGDKIYAFGHPFFAPGGIGISDMPMAESKVVTVVPNLLNSFKLSVTGNMVGAIKQDRYSGIYGKLGVAPKLIPLTITMSSRGKKAAYNMEVIADNNLTPLLVQLSTLNSIITTERSFGDLTLTLEGKIRIKNQPPIVFSNGFSANNAFISTIIYLSYPLGMLYSSGFNFDVEGIEVNLTAADRRAYGTLTRLAVDRTEARRGETINIQAYARNEQGEIRVQKIPVVIPVDAPLGRLNVTVGDGGVMANLDQRAIIDSNPKNLIALVKAMNKLPKNNRLYVKLYYSDTGAVVNNEELPSLPPSMLAALDSARSTNGYLPLAIATLLTEELPPAQFFIGGQQTISIKVLP
ncbi:MAG: SpoIVB peptidase S55 domain-containing protein [Acidobacteriota bacterium]